MANTLTSLGEVLGYQGRFVESEAFFEKSLGMRRRIQGENHPDVAFDLARFATMLSQKGDADEAASLYREALDRHRRLYPQGSLRITKLVHLLTDLLVRRGETDTAERYLRDQLAEEYRRENNAYGIATTQARLAACLAAAGRFAEAEPLFRESYERLSLTVGPTPRATGMVLERLATFYGRGESPMQPHSLNMRPTRLQSCDHPINSAALPVLYERC